MRWKKSWISEYPDNFNCIYEVLATKASKNSCYDLILDSKFGLETSVACQADRVELYDVINGKLVTMDNSNENITVFCGDGQFNNYWIKFKDHSQLAL